MAPDILSKIGAEIDERLGELRPLIAEYEQLLVASDALFATGGRASLPGSGKGTVAAKGPVRVTSAGANRRGSARTTTKLAPASATQLGGKVDGESARQDRTTAARVVTAPTRSATKRKPERAVRGAARDAILGALEHGSHTVGELVVVTAMSAPNINGNLRRLVTEGAVVKTEREGRAAWARPDMAAGAA